MFDKLKDIGCTFLQKVQLAHNQTRLGRLGIGTVAVGFDFVDNLCVSQRKHNGHIGSFDILPAGVPAKISSHITRKKDVVGGVGDLDGHLQIEHHFWNHGCFRARVDQRNQTHSLEKIVKRRMTALPDKSVIEQMEAAASKENSEWAKDTVNKISHLYALILCRLYADFARGFVWARNCQSATSEDAPPRGFQFNVSPRAPVHSAPFTAAPMFRGTIMYPLAFATQRGGPITYDNLVQSISRESLGANFLTEPDDYAGIFANFNSSGQPQFYCCVQGHNPEISRLTENFILQQEPESFEKVNEFLRYLVDLRAKHAEKAKLPTDASELYDAVLQDWAEAKTPLQIKEPYMSWRQLFETAEMRRFQAEQQHHRAKLICRTMKLFSLDRVGVSSSIDDNAQIIIQNAATVSSTFNCVERFDKQREDSDMVYLNNMASAWTVGRTGYVWRAGATRLLWQTGPLVDQKFSANTPPFIGLPYTTTFDGKAEQTEVSLFVGSAPLQGVPFRDYSYPSWAEWQHGVGLGGRHMILSGVRVIAGPSLVVTAAESKSVYR